MNNQNIKTSAQKLLYEHSYFIIFMKHITHNIWPLRDLRASIHAPPPSLPPSLRPPLQVSSWGRCRSRGSRRPRGSPSATTWPPSCRAASPWSTASRTTTPSSTRTSGPIKNDKTKEVKKSGKEAGARCVVTTGDGRREETLRHWGGNEGVWLMFIIHIRREK